MKCQIYYTALLLASIFLTSASCNKTNMPDDDKDWNILEWTVDRQKYKATCNTGTIISGCDPVDCQYYTDTKTLSFRGGYNKHSLKVYIRRDANLGNYKKIQRYDKIFYGNGNLTSDCGRYYIDTNFNYHIEFFRIDTIQKIIEGDLSFTGINDCNDTSHIESGYFKLSYRP